MKSRKFYLDSLGFNQAGGVRDVSNKHMYG